ncbi:hypothetical protein [Shewanella sp. MTB7]|nr:hypothetical protein [Shewanella sp. MTB7]WBJ93577.1 hypothetical protein HWQ47_16785 [Shewanella sp. MTB7]
MKQQFPELASLTHLALLGRVVAIGEAVSPGHIQTAYRPAFGVDVQLLNPDGSDNTAVPVFRNVPLPGATHHGQGQFAYPQTDCVVELGFAFGHTHQPFVRTILGLNWSMPGVDYGDHLTQFNEGFHRIDSGGSQQLHSEQAIALISQGMTLNTDHLNQTLGEHTRQVDGHDTESSLGHRVIQANILSLLGLSGLQLGTDKDYELLANGSLLETVANLRQSIAKTHWAGSKDTNIYQLLLQIMSVVETLAKTASSHTHTSSKSGTPTSAPLQAGDFTGQSSTAKQLQTTLSPLI